MTAPLPPEPPSLDLSGLQSSLSELGNSLASMTSRLNSMDLAGTLVSKIESTSASLGNAVRAGVSGSTELRDKLRLLSAAASANAAELEAAFKNLQTASLMPDNAAAIEASKTAFESASLAGVNLSNEFIELKKTTNGLIDSFEEVRLKNEKLLKSINQSPMDMIVNKLAGGDDDKARILGAVIGKITTAFTAVFAEVGKIAMQGMRRAAELGISATEGVELEFKNRAAAVGTMFTFDANKMVTTDQINATQTAFMSTFAGLREGTELSSSGMTAFAQELKTGFKSEFQLTGQSMRDLATIGASSAEDFDKFRQASGRASLSSTQFSAIVGKNSLSFLLFGNSFARAAADAERLGISLAGVQRGQESYVTNLDGAIDTIAQLNQMGAQVDFGTLTQLAEFGTPEEVAKYIAATVPADMMNSASMRSLFGQLMPGMDAESLLRMAKTGSALDEMEGKVTDAAKESTTLATGLAAVTRIVDIAKNTFYEVVKSALGAAWSLKALAASATFAATANKASGVAGAAGMSGMSRLLMGAGGLGVGYTGVTLGKSLADEGYTKTGIGVGALGGGLGAALLAMALAPATGGLSLAALAGVGALVGGGTVAALSDKPTLAQDMISPPGYGARTLVTPTGNYALNNEDTVMAGTQLFDKGSLNTAKDESQLIRKVDQLISALQNANTTIQVNGQTQSVSRLQLVGVYTRNEIT